MPQCQTLGYDKRYQVKLARALFQWPEESRQILEHLPPAAFTVPAAAWLVGKLRWSWTEMRIPATLDMLRAELRRETKQQVLDEDTAVAVGRLVKRLKEPVADKTYLFDTAHDFCRTAEVERFFLKHVDDITQKGRVDWGHYDATCAGRWPLAHVSMATWASTSSTRSTSASRHARRPWTRASRPARCSTRISPRWAATQAAGPRYGRHGSGQVHRAGVPRRSGP